MNHSKNKFRRRKKNDFLTHPKNGSRKRSSGRKSNGSRISPESLIRKSGLTREVAVPIGRKFHDLAIDPRLKQILVAKGYSEMTEIQDGTFENLLSGNDLMGIAKTGTGKTGAFLIPLIQRLISGESFQTMVLVPTRELAQQVEMEFKSLTSGLNLYSVCLIGGTSVSKDIQRLRKPNQLIIGTPGRTQDLINRGILKPQGISVLILDEFDRMLDMGFSKEVMHIAGIMKNRRQTVLFSATENFRLQGLLDELLNEPHKITSSTESKTSDFVDQDIIKVTNPDEKFSILLNLIQNPTFKKVLIFSETKRGVSKLTLKLKKSGILVDEIHGDRSQFQRNKALNKFKFGHIQVLTATDVAARGLDIEDITHVINYQIPRDMESYIHRIGRTGRAGKSGIALTLID